jgi:hypothetical protein
LLLSEFAFTGSSECAFYPTLQDANRDVLRSPAHLKSFPLWNSRHTLTLASPASLFPSSLPVRDGRAAKSQTAHGFSSSSTSTSSASRAALEISEALSTRRAVWPSHTSV